MKSILALLVVVLGIILFILWRLDLFPVTPSDRYTQDEKVCVALIVVVDTTGEPSPHSSVIDERIIKTVLNYSRRYRTDICEIFRKQLTLIPLGSTRKWTPDRNKKYIWAEYSSDTINAALVKVEKIMALPPDPSWKATHYVRADRWLTFGNQSQKEIAGIRAMTAVPKKLKKGPDGKTMIPNPDAGEGVIEFFEPKD